MSLDTMVENVWAKGFARYVMPLLGIIVIGSAGWAFNWGVTKIVETLEKHGELIASAASRAGEAAKEVKSLRNESALRFEDTGRRLDGVSAKLDRYDDRIRVLEIKVRP